ncbi:MAG: cation-translocating P-type ATPase, partial [Chloroflexi bacterium]|nr:cation-translocating P-type ATPase [Chloroflexota bacterium]
MKINSNWHNLEAQEALTTLNSSTNGLSREEANRRLAQYGPNELAEKKKASPWLIFLEQFKNFLIIILLVAVVLSAILNEVADAIVIAVIVVFAAGLGFIQEYRAERAMAALKKMAALTASVMRDGKEIEIPARELVPGDIILIRTGDKIPADSRLINAVNLQTEEAPLTGESVPVEKTDEPVSGEVSIGDKKNMTFMGTAAVYGRGMAVVVATGMATEFGKIAALLQEVKGEQTPLQLKLDQMGKWIGIGALVLTVILGGLGVIRGHGILEMLIWGVSLAVAAVPEALPAVVTISLAFGVQRMVKRHALVRKLPSVETLGSTTVICSDKTGTLTQDQMTVRRIYVDGQQIDVSGSGYQPEGEFSIAGAAFTAAQSRGMTTLLSIGILCNDTSLICENGDWKIKGDPTEGALVVAAAKAGLLQQDLISQFPRLGEIPFSSETKRMATLHQSPQGKVAYVKGAPEVILILCRDIFDNGQERALSKEDRDTVLGVAHAMAGDALRVLGVAYKRLPENAIVSEDIEREMTFVGLAGMIDSPREEVKEAVRVCDAAGIKSVMITGDHQLTAVAIAKELGILKEGGLALTGAELDKMSDQQFESLVEKIAVYARVSPVHKLRVVEALTKKGHVVAMTGDGVNDAPALKRADIGVAMGITGTDVTKEVADMVLTDDNFASIVAAVEEGRVIFSNIKKYLMYLLSSNIGEVLLMATVILFGPLIGLPSGAIPLIAIQILFVNLVTDGLPAIALSVDPADPDIMKQKPRPRGQGIFTKPVLVLMATAGCWISLVNLVLFKWALDAGKTMNEAQSLVFLTLIIIQFFNAYNFRSDEKSIFALRLFANKWLNLSIISQVVLMLAVFYLPFLQGVFGTYPLSAMEWLLVILVAG